MPSRRRRFRHCCLARLRGLQERARWEGRNPGGVVEGSGMAYQTPTWSFHSAQPAYLIRKPEDLLPRIAAMIQTEFQKLPVAAGTVTAQPSPNTLRGAETNFFAEAAEQQFDITILAQSSSRHCQARAIHLELWRRHVAGTADCGRRLTPAGSLGRKDPHQPRLHPDRRLLGGADHPFPRHLLREWRPASAHPRPRPIQLAAADRQRLALDHPELRR